MLKQVGIAVREQLPEGAYLELFVKVDKDWQRRPRPSSASATELAPGATAVSDRLEEGLGLGAVVWCGASGGGRRRWSQR